jgi:hypothetical protein
MVWGTQMTFGRVSEAAIKAQMVKSVRLAGGYARRIEDQFLVGMPDTILIPWGCPVFFAEVKKVRGLQLAPSPRQYIEMDRINKAGANHAIAILVGWKDETFYFHEAAQIAKLTDCFSVTSRVMDFNEQLIQFYHGRLASEK